MRSEPSYTHTNPYKATVQRQLLASAYQLYVRSHWHRMHLKKSTKLTYFFPFYTDSFSYYSLLWVGSGMAGTTTGYMKRYEFNLYANFTCQI